jgi:hypothetical protein
MTLNLYFLRMMLVQLLVLASKPPIQYASALGMVCQSMTRRCGETIARNNKSEGSLMTLNVKDLAKS